jgi:hypothetical protein
MSIAYTHRGEAVEGVPAQDTFGEALESADASGGVDLVTPSAAEIAANKRVHITDISISVGAALWVQILDSTADTPVVVISKKYLPANSVWSYKYARHNKRAAVGKKLVLKTSGAGNVSVDIAGYIR